MPACDRGRRVHLFQHSVVQVRRFSNSLRLAAMAHSAGSVINSGATRRVRNPGPPAGSSPSRPPSMRFDTERTADKTLVEDFIVNESLTFRLRWLGHRDSKDRVWHHDRQTALQRCVLKSSGDPFGMKELAIDSPGNCFLFRDAVVAGQDDAKLARLVLANPSHRVWPTYRALHGITGHSGWYEASGSKLAPVA